MSASSETQVLLGITAQAIEVRRSLEPMAWLVLEELALTVPGSTERPLGVRSIAAALGHSPDAVARALRSLIETGLVERTTARDEGSGRFGAATYTVHLAGAGLHVPTPTPSAMEAHSPPPDHAQQPAQRAARSTENERLF